MIQPFRKIRTQNKELTQLQNSLARIFLDLLGLPILDGRLIEGVSISTAGAVIDHGLNREPKGWIVVKKTDNTGVWQTAQTSKTLTLDASRVDTISLWVF